MLNFYGSPNEAPRKERYVFVSDKDDLMITYTYPIKTKSKRGIISYTTGTMTINQRYLAEGPKAKVSALLKSIPKDAVIS